MVATEIYTLSLHDALPILLPTWAFGIVSSLSVAWLGIWFARRAGHSFRTSTATIRLAQRAAMRSEEHTSELHSLTNFVCRLVADNDEGPQARRSAGALRGR